MLFVIPRYVTLHYVGTLRYVTVVVTLPRCYGEDVVTFRFDPTLLRWIVDCCVTLRAVDGRYGCYVADCCYVTIALRLRWYSRYGYGSVDSYDSPRWCTHRYGCTIAVAIAYTGYRATIFRYFVDLRSTLRLPFCGYVTVHSVTLIVVVVTLYYVVVTVTLLRYDFPFTGYVVGYVIPPRSTVPVPVTFDLRFPHLPHVAFHVVRCYTDLRLRLLLPLVTVGSRLIVDWLHTRLRLHVVTLYVAIAYVGI